MDDRNVAPLVAGGGFLLRDSAPADELPGEGPVLLFDPVEVRDDFPLREVARRLNDQAVLFSKRFRCEGIARVRLADEEAAACDRCCDFLIVHLGS